MAKSRISLVFSLLAIILLVLSIIYIKNKNYFAIFFKPTYNVVVAPVPSYTGENEQQSITMPAVIFTHELLKRLEKDFGYRFDYYYANSWQEAERLYNNKQVDILFPEIVGDTTRAGITSSLVGKAQGFAIYNTVGSKCLHSSNDLAHKITGLIKGRYYPFDIITNATANFQYFPDLPEAFQAIYEHKVDLVLENPWIAEPVRVRLGLNNLQHGEVFSPHYITYRFQLADDIPQLVEAFNVVISNMLLDGSYKKIFINTPEAFLIKGEADSSVASPSCSQ